MPRCEDGGGGLAPSGVGAAYPPRLLPPRQKIKWFHFQKGRNRGRQQVRCIRNCYSPIGAPPSDPSASPRRPIATGVSSVRSAMSSSLAAS